MCRTCSGRTKRPRRLPQKSRSLAYFRRVFRVMIRQMEIETNSPQGTSRGPQLQSITGNWKIQKDDKKSLLNINQTPPKSPPPDQRQGNSKGSIPKAHSFGTFRYL